MIGAELIKELEGNLKESKKNLASSSELLSSQAGQYISGNFGSISEKDKMVFWWLSIISIVLILSTIVIAYVTYKDIADLGGKSFDAAFTLIIFFRVGILGLAVFLITYLISNANKYRKEYFRNRDISVKFLAFEPYLKEIKDEKEKSDIRKKFAEQMFKPLDE